VTSPAKTLALIAFGLALVATGIYFSYANDAPGAAVGGFVPMFAAVWIGVRTARNRLPIGTRRTALAVGGVIAAVAAIFIHVVSVAAPLFAQSPEVPSVSKPSPSSKWTAAVDRARPLVRAAIMEQNLPGVSIAVGAGMPSEALAKEGGGIVWAEGFGWRDVVTETPVTPETRFNIGTAASVLTAAAVGPLGLTNTGTDPAAAWSPEHVGEPEEDFPGFTAIRHLVLQPLGLALAEYPLPGERATFYVPRSDDHDPRRGRLLMYMRDLACCANGKASYSTPSDLVRFALATHSDSVSGDLAGGSVMSLVTRRDKGIVVVVASNIAHADTAALAAKVADAFQK